MGTNYVAVPTSIELQSPQISRKGADLVGDYDLAAISDGLPLISSPSSAPRQEGSGVAGAVFNLATSIIGAGIMALPAAMKVLGVFPGLASILVMGVLSELTIELLVRFAADRGCSSYGDLVGAALGRLPRGLAELSIVLNNAGILVVYLIIIGDVLSGRPGRALGVFDEMLGLGIWDDRRLLILAILLTCLAPLCSLDRIESLALTSAASVALAVVFVVVSCAIAAIKLFTGDLQAPRAGPDFTSPSAVVNLLVVIPIMTNAYVCHFNVPVIYNELDCRTPKKMNAVGRITTALCVTVYALTAMSGYLLFGDDTDSDVLTNFSRDLGVKFGAILNDIVRIGYVIHLILVFPVIHFSLRQTLCSAIFSSPHPPSRARMLALTAVILAVLYLGSVVVPNIWVAFKFTGATTGMALGFIFPSLVALRLDKEGKCLRRGEKMLAIVVLVLAVVASVVGVIGNVYSLKSQAK